MAHGRTDEQPSVFPNARARVGHPHSSFGMLLLGPARTTQPFIHASTGSERATAHELDYNNERGPSFIQGGKAHSHPQKMRTTVGLLLCGLAGAWRCRVGRGASCVSVSVCVSV